MNDKILANELKKWFNLHSADKNRWCLNPVGILIKNELKNLDNWKNASRGNSKKACRKMKWVMACRNGYEGPFEG